MQWTFGTGEDGVEAPPAIGRNGTIYVTDRKRLYALDRDTGITKWTFTSDDNTNFTDLGSSPVIGADGTIYVTGWNLTTDHGILFAINPDDGSKKWANSDWESVEAYGYHNPPAVGADGAIYFGSLDSYIYKVVDLVTDGLLNVVGGPTEGQEHSSPALGYDGGLYIGCKLSIKKFDIGSSGPANSSWPLYRGNLKRTAKVDHFFFSKGLLKFLRKLAVDYHFDGGIENSLLSKLDSALESLVKEKEEASANKLNAFINEVRALKNKKVLTSEADRLILEARRLIDSIVGEFPQ